MNNKIVIDVEEKLLTSISGDFKTSDLLKMIVNASEDAGEEVVDNWLELVQEALNDKDDVSGMLKLLVIRGKIGRISRKALEEALIHTSKDRTWQAKVKACDFAGKEPLDECFRRMSVLHKLSEGSYCFEKTWGFGVVRRLDAFYSKVTVDFTRKKNHQMAFGYAGASLTILHDNHIYVLLCRAPEKIAEIVKDDPAEIVRMVLRDTGPNTVDDIKDILIEMNVLKDADWKTFWDRARKDLKTDPLVEIPTKRTAPLTILDKARGYDDDWVASLKKERDLLKLLVMFDALIASGEKDLPMAAYDAITERCAFIAKAAEGSQWAILARLVIVGRGLAEIVGTDPAEGRIQSFFSEKALTNALSGLNVKLGTTLLQLMMAEDADLCSKVLVQILENIPVNLVGDAAYHMKTAGKEADFLAKVTESINARTVGPVVFSWACRTPGIFDKLTNVGRYELVNGVIDMLEGDFNGEQLKGQNTIRTCFEDKTWLTGLFKGLPDAQLETLVKRIAESKGWEEASRRSVLAKLLKMNPDVVTILSTTVPDEEEGDLRVTSWRSFRARSATLKKIVEIDIPANSKEIGVARSYGDLRENHEYKAAKEHQGILMRRQEELERDLKTVQGTDFVGLPCDKIGPGTIAVIKRPDGREEEYCVLGEWDRDATLNIISSQSKLALSLQDAKTGDKITVPSETGEEVCEVVSIKPLSDAVKEWINGQPE